MILGHEALNPLSNFLVSGESKMSQFAPGALWRLGFNDVGVTRALMASAHALIVCVVGVYLLAFLVVLLGKAHSPQELGVNLLRRRVWPGFLEAISVPFVRLAVCGSWM